MPTDLQLGVSRIASVNPATGEVLGELDCAGPTEVRAAVGRDYADVPPTRGTFKGEVESELAISVAAPGVCQGGQKQHGQDGDDYG